MNHNLPLNNSHNPIIFRLLDMDGVVSRLPVPGAAMASRSRPLALSSRERCASSSARLAANVASISALIFSLSAFSFFLCSILDVCPSCDTYDQG